MHFLSNKIFWFVLTASLFSMTGCTRKPKVQLSGLSSLSKPPFVLPVASLSFVPPETSSSAAAEGNVASLMNPSPAVIVDQWAKDRFSVGGSVSGGMTRSGGQAVLTLEDASILEKSVESSDSLQDALVKYTCTLSLRFEIFGEDGLSRAHSQVASTVSRVVPDRLTFAEREKVWLSLTETALNQIDQALEKKLQAYMDTLS